MSETLWSTLLGAGIMLLGSVINHMFALINTRRKADRRQQRQAERWRWRAAKRQEKAASARTSHQEKRRQAYLLQCWEHVLTVSVRVKQMSDMHRTGSEFPVQEEPALFSARAYTAAMQGLPTVYPLAKAFHEATLKIQIAYLQGEFAHVANALYAWGKSLDALEAEIARQFGVISDDAAGSDDAPDGEAASSKAV